MIFVILGIGIGLVVLGVILIEKTNDFEILGTGIVSAGAVVAVTSAIITFALAITVSYNATIDDKIAMYEEENTRIEEQIATVVKQYQDYESDIFSELSPESSIPLISIYPELKSDTLVQEQISVYISNNQKIKQLKEDKVTDRVDRWWLYFGGKE